MADFHPSVRRSQYTHSVQVPRCVIGHCSGAGVMHGMAGPLCEQHRDWVLSMPIPWIGQQHCPHCDATWTMPWEDPSGLWHCIACHRDFR